MDERIPILNDGEAAEGLPADDQASRQRARRALIVALVLCIIFMVLEVVGGYLANSMAIMSDAAHLLTDVGALSLSLFALHMSARPADRKYTYGWHRAEMLGALVSIFSIWFLTGVIVYEAITRTVKYSKCAGKTRERAAHDGDCEEVDGKIMLVIGGCGLLVNIMVAVVLTLGNAKVSHSHSHSADEDNNTHSHGNKADDGGNVNVRSAMIHAIGDCVQSVGVLIAAAVVWGGNSTSQGTAKSSSSWYNLADPVISLFFAIITLWTTVGLFRQVLRVLMEGVPDNVDFEKLVNDLSAEFGEDGYHDLHVWALTVDKPALSIHVTSTDPNALATCKAICKKHGISHTTVEVADVTAEQCDSRPC